LLGKRTHGLFETFEDFEFRAAFPDRKQKPDLCCRDGKRKIAIIMLWGALGRAVHQAVSKKRPKPAMLDIPFGRKFVCHFDWTSQSLPTISSC
jgi:hypothetical protein